MPDIKCRLGIKFLSEKYHLMGLVAIDQSITWIYWSRKVHLHFYDEQGQKTEIFFFFWMNAHVLLPNQSTQSIQNRTNIIKQAKKATSDNDGMRINHVEVLSRCFVLRRNLDVLVEIQFYTVSNWISLEIDWIIRKKGLNRAAINKLIVEYMPRTWSWGKWRRRTGENELASIKRNNQFVV